MKKFTTDLDGRPVEVAGPIDNDDDRRRLRADVDFHDGTVVLLSYPSRVFAFHGDEPPRTMSIPAGGFLVKDEAGDFTVIAPASREGAILEGAAR